MKIRTYSELMSFSTFEERFAYLKLNGVVAENTFGSDRYLNQKFYSTDQRWKKVRREVILRDTGNGNYCRDLGVEGYDIHGPITIHHMNPIEVKDILEVSDFLLNPEFLIATSSMTHKAIHYGDASLLITKPIVRLPGDTCPWKRL